MDLRLKDPEGHEWSFLLQGAGLSRDRVIVKPEQTQIGNHAVGWRIAVSVLHTALVQGPGTTLVMDEVHMPELCCWMYGFGGAPRATRYFNIISLTSRSLSLDSTPVICTIPRC